MCQHHVKARRALALTFELPDTYNNIIFVEEDEQVSHHHSTVDVGCKVESLLIGVQLAVAVPIQASV